MSSAVRPGRRAAEWIQTALFRRTDIAYKTEDCREKRCHETLWNAEFIQN